MSNERSLRQTFDPHPLTLEGVHFTHSLWCTISPWWLFYMPINRPGLIDSRMQCFQAHQHWEMLFSALNEIVVFVLSVVSVIDTNGLWVTKHTRYITHTLVIFFLLKFVFSETWKCNKHKRGIRRGHSSHRFWVHCGWRAEEPSPGSSSGPTQTDTCTLQSHFELLRPHCWSRSSRPETMQTTPKSFGMKCTLTIKCLQNTLWLKLMLKLDAFHSQHAQFI